MIYFSLNLHIEKNQEDNLKHLFVVDDSITTLKLAENALKDHFELTLLTSGTQLFAALARRLPDLILLDIEMPDIDGMTIVEKLKSVIGWEKIPVIFLTSHSEKQVVMTGFELGVLDYIVKPFDVAALPERIKKHLKV